MSLPDPNQQGHPHIQETPLRRTSPDFRKAVTRARTPAPSPIPGRHRSRPPSTDDNRHLPFPPERIRERRFTLRRRGVDPDEITAFLGRVADELAVARTALTAVREENARIKDALRTWQSAERTSPREPARW